MPQQEQPMNRPRVLVAIFFMSLSALCFSAVEMTGAHLVQGVSPFQVVWTRYMVHLIFMTAVLGPHYRTTLVKTHRLPLQIIRSLTMLAMPVCFILAASAMPVNDVWSVYWVSPLIVLGLAVWVLREPVGMTRWILAGLGFGGMLLIFKPDRGVLSPASILALSMGTAISLHLMFSRILRHDHPLTSLFHTALWVFLSLSLVIPFLWSSPSTRTWIGMVIIGLVGAIGLYSLARSGELVPLPVVASFAYTEALWTLLLNLLLFGVWPSTRVLLGAAVIACVTVYQVVYEYLQQSRPKRESAP